MRAGVVLLILAGGVVVGQEGQVLPEILELRRRCAAQIAAGDVSLQTRRLAELQELETSRAAAGDYEGAQRVAVVREGVLGEAAARADTRARVLLQAREVTTRGSGLRDDPATGVIFFSKKGATVEWDVRGQFSGWYEVRLRCAVKGSPRTKDGDSGQEEKKAGGVVAFSRVGGLGAAAAPVVHGVEGTGGWNLYETVVIGRMALSNGPVRLRLVAEKAASEGLMNLARVELVPVSGPVAVEAADVLPGALVKAREVFLKSYAERARGATERYRKELAVLEAAFEKAKDREGVARVKQERARVAGEPDPGMLSGGDGERVRTVVMGVGDVLGCSWRGECRLSNTKDVLGGLRPAGGASVLWKLRAFGVPTGSWDVKIKARVGALGGGTAELQFLGAGGVALGEPVAVEVEPVQTAEEREKNRDDEDAKVPDAESRTIDAGRMTIPKQAETLILRVSGLTHGDGTLFDLKAVELQPGGGA
jgi:hypothetical protein